MTQFQYTTNEPMLLLHGEHTLKSRQELVAALDAAHQAGKQVVRLEAKQITPAALEQAFQAQSLFGQPRLVVVEGLHSLPRGKKRTSLIKQLAALAEQAADDTQVIVWEKRKLTKTMLKRFSGAEVKHFRSSSAVFTWLDSLTGQPSPADRRRMSTLLDDALAAEDDYFCFIMLIRQVRLMLISIDGDRVPGPPFVARKIAQQAQTFTRNQLVQLLKQLLETDLAHKQSATHLDLGAELDLLVTTL